MIPRVSFPHEPEPALVDPEAFDTSEERFEDSLISSPDPEYRSIQLGPESDLQEMVESRSQETNIRLNGIEKHAAEQRSLAQESDNWRDEISSRLNNYAKRRGRKRLGGEFSMQLDFERPRRSNAATAPALDPVMDPLPQEQAPPMAASHVVEDDTELSSVPHVREANVGTTEIPVLETPKPRRHHRVIEFPRLFPMEQAEPSSDELAETLDRPRILDVPEETDQIVLPLADISLEMQQQAEEAATAPAREFELPIQVASISQRIFGTIADSALVLFATAMFAGIVLNIAKGLPHNKLTLMAGLAVPNVLWGLYQYLFLVHGATTPGMKIAQLRLATFNGQPTNRQVRRARALALMLSLVSAGMGLGWALVDEDTLCWHDRISRTYLTNR